MMITEHNCEDCFLLYIDNELSAPDRAAVEDFVNNHPQYMPLFKALQQTKLTDDIDTSFFNKEALYKDETHDIGVANYEEYFLLYADNELSDDEKETTERFVLQHPQLQEEFTLLQQTKLTPDVIAYKDKEKLYKKERRIIPLYLTGLSVAAAVLAVLFFTGLFAPHQQADGNLASVPVQQKVDHALTPERKQTIPDVAVNHQREESRQNLPASEKIKQGNEKSKGIHTINDKSSIVKKEPETQVSQPSHNEVALAHVPEETHEIAQVSLPENKPAAKQVATLKPLEEFTAEPANATETLSLSDNNVVQPAVYKELNTEADNHTLYVSGIQLNKNKVSGFLKSASRLLGGKNRQDSE